MNRLQRLASFLALLATGCTSTAFSTLPTTTYTRTDNDGGDVHEIELSTSTQACGTTFPAGSRLHFDRGMNDGLSWASLGAPATLDGHTYAANTKLTFYSTPKKVFAAEECTLVGVVLAADDTFGSNRFGAKDSLSGYKNGAFRHARLGAERSVGGKAYAAGFELELDDHGAVASAKSPQDRAAGEARANAAQKAADDKRSACSNRCAPYPAISRADCINNCLYH